ncbi:hypothetical protein ACFLV3_06650 [Chloroflexota bacterium]
MDREDINTDYTETKWFIDLDWFQQNERSFPFLAQNCLCPKCRKRLKVDKKEATANDLLSAIKSCCSKAPGFIAPKMPALESIFRLFLANGNQPLYLEELGKQLSKWRGGDTYRTSDEVLPRLLKNDCHYGLRQVQN